MGRGARRPPDTASTPPRREAIGVRWRSRTARESWASSRRTSRRAPATRARSAGGRSSWSGGASTRSPRPRRADRSRGAGCAPRCRCRPASRGPRPARPGARRAWPSAARSGGSADLLLEGRHVRDLGAIAARAIGGEPPRVGLGRALGLDRGPRRLDVGGRRPQPARELLAPAALDDLPRRTGGLDPAGEPGIARRQTRPVVRGRQPTAVGRDEDPRIGGRCEDERFRHRPATMPQPAPAGERPAAISRRGSARGYSLTGGWPGASSGHSPRYSFHSSQRSSPLVQ
jgi:hypothetical protein